MLLGSMRLKFSARLTYHIGQLLKTVEHGISHLTWRLIQLGHLAIVRRYTIG
jgi:hypothetical protein